MASIISKSESDTIDFAHSCALQAKTGDVFTLQGPLGAGKSVFCRAFIQQLMGNAVEVPSPTFTLVQTYSAPKVEIWHFDLYRIEDPEEIYEIGWEEALSDGVLLIEWPERLGSLLPKIRKEIIFDQVNGESRHIHLIDHQESASDASS